MSGGGLRGHRHRDGAIERESRGRKAYLQPSELPLQLQPFPG